MRIQQGMFAVLSQFTGKYLVSFRRVFFFFFFGLQNFRKLCITTRETRRWFLLNLSIAAGKPACGFTVSQLVSSNVFGVYFEFELVLYCALYLAAHVASVQHGNNRHAPFLHHLGSRLSKLLIMWFDRFLRRHNSTEGKQMIEKDFFFFFFHLCFFCGRSNLEKPAHNSVYIS